MSSYDASTDRGCHANIHWRAVAESDLSQHPLYRSLGAVNKGETSDPRMIPQHSVQWEELHYGRLTTSKLASILGFYEQDIAEFLGIPRSLRGHHRVVEGWQQLRANPITTTSQTTSSSSSNAFKIETPWKPSDSCKFPFAYCPNSCPPCGPKGLNDATLARLHWGSAQESTAILCAVNYLSSLDSSLVVAEAGMQVFELLADPPSSLERMVKEWQDNKEFPLLGASPDGLIYNSTGQLVSVLEAKCTSPFVASTRPGSFLQVQKSRPHEELLPVWHIPQLQLEMFCAGSSCRSAVVVVLAVDSAKIIKVHRDDEVSCLGRSVHYSMHSLMI